MPPGKRRDITPFRHRTTNWHDHLGLIVMALVSTAIMTITIVTLYATGP